MPLSRTLSRASSPADAVRQALIGSLYKVHRPELADVVASADLTFDCSGVWLRPQDASLSSTWLGAPAPRGGARKRVAFRFDPGARGNRAGKWGAGRMRQAAWWCRACANPALVAQGLCRACYDRRRHSVRFFGGFREQVLARDRCCQVCLAERLLVVHHRRPGTDRPAAQITLCIRCHVRLHRRRQLPGVYGDLFFRLWREQHPGCPAQLCLPYVR